MTVPGGGFSVRKFTEVRTQGRRKLRAWTVLAERKLLSTEPWFSVSVQKVQLPDGSIIDNYHQIIFPDYVTIVARDKMGNYIMVRKYCHGFRRTCMVTPGGMKNRREKPLAGAVRELLEETGYVAGRWVQLGCYMQHSNYGCGSVYMFLADSCVKRFEPDSGDIEEMDVVLLSKKEMKKYMKSGSNPSLSCALAFELAIGHGDGKVSRNTKCTSSFCLAKRPSACA